MANKKKEGAAIEKRAKIDRAQKNMFIAVCLASMAIGISIVATIYLVKLIAFNGNVLEEQKTAIEGFKESQENLSSLDQSVRTMADNDNLEVVARERDDRKCIGKTNKGKEEEGSDNKNAGIDAIAMCTSLRVIPDALPSTLNKNATLASMNWLLNVSEVNIESLSGGEASEDSDSEDFSEDEGEGGGSSSSATHVTGVGISLTDKADRIALALTAIEHSIRNFDVESFSLSWSGESMGTDEIEYTGTYKAYYSDRVALDFKSKQVCADKTSEKCSGESSSDDEGSEE
ncbi:hypothetical protein IKF15_02980 [Candidatus Saccharibacteria bacterium]|nr:hypothetical protein [Candidatus Saccharibacteria bacterium]